MILEVRKCYQMAVLKNHQKWQKCLIEIFEKWDFLTDNFKHFHWYTRVNFQCCEICFVHEIASWNSMRYNHDKDQILVDQKRCLMKKSIMRKTSWEFSKFQKALNAFIELARVLIGEMKYLLVEETLLTSEQRTTIALIALSTFFMRGIAAPDFLDKLHLCQRTCSEIFAIREEITWCSILFFISFCPFIVRKIRVTRSNIS